MVSRIKESSKLVRGAEVAGKSAQQSIDRLIHELAKGNMNPGIGTKPIGKGISEARASDGARVYFRQLQDGTIGILGKSTKANQSMVISKVLELLGGYPMSMNKYNVSVIGPQGWNTLDDNIDVEVAFSDGRRYAATVFTLRNIESLFKKNRETGEYMGGTYLWASGMILVENLEYNTIVSTIDSLIQDCELHSAFSLISCNEMPEH